MVVWHSSTSKTLHGVTPRMQQENQVRVRQVARLQASVSVSSRLQVFKETIHHLFQVLLIRRVVIAVVVIDVVTVVVDHASICSDERLMISYIAVVTAYLGQALNAKCIGFPSWSHDLLTSHAITTPLFEELNDFDGQISRLYSWTSIFTVSIVNSITVNNSVVIAIDSTSRVRLQQGIVMLAGGRLEPVLCKGVVPGEQNLQCLGWTSPVVVTVVIVIVATIIVIIATKVRMGHEQNAKGSRGSFGYFRILPPNLPQVIHAFECRTWKTTMTCICSRF
jgi:hypothetical protein